MSPAHWFILCWDMRGNMKSHQHKEADHSSWKGWNKLQSFVRKLEHYKGKDRSSFISRVWHIYSIWDVQTRTTWCPLGHPPGWLRVCHRFQVVGLRLAESEAAQFPASCLAKLQLDLSLKEIIEQAFNFLETLSDTGRLCDWKLWWCNSTPPDTQREIAAAVQS